MTYPPKSSDYCRVANLSMARNNRGDSDHVVRVGGVPHAEKKTERDDGEQADHSYVMQM